MPEIPKIISVDDHVVEPPDLWVERLPSKYKDKGPRVERDRAIFNPQCRTPFFLLQMVNWELFPIIL